uniref:C2H2-type domain-containing protein n=1 Tax=Physcomitrium patens TaxID=3218 RepID=A0A7I4EHF7_PHYPA|nr:protein TRANSPARENT TESTA 1-like isoform X1 [Physcomitrium patens]XP_024384177.1 protein TRANSPARENT TESTA 1-like isoform X1 [Physcomitrium patens]XP_024384179.1 protein TRANSPARENT TESTA 1-like isoform X1 [Physcomitrium patens]XP_024384180.1 protein TRANSPARENT TESTA 1-like isoform X1 [Physcomitrium patens]|eukprot:XP_024384176.1 protein TRANSPARENT TESTA 1-like isoform X1 [Physcomitrella patens]
MPDVSMVQQGLNYPATPEWPLYEKTSFLPLLDNVAMTSQSLAGTSTPPFGITRLSRSQSQVLQFLDSGTVFDPPSTPSHERAPLLDLHPTKLNSPSPINTPVMHPNLVCTLKSILSPKLEFNGQTTSGDCGFTQYSGYSQVIEMAELQGSEHGNSLGADYPGKSSPEITFRPSNNNNLKQMPDNANFLQQKAILVPVDLIQNRRPYQCAFAGCQKTFKNPQTMRMHHKTHFSDAAAAQLGAEAVLTATAPLKAGHNKKIPSRCPTCYKTFVGLYELRRHFGRKHSEGEKSHACRKCGKRFHIEVDVRDHEKLCGEPIVCSCGMKFAFKCNLVAHRRSHPKCQDRPVAAETEKRLARKPLNSEESTRGLSDMPVQNFSVVTRIAAEMASARPQLPQSVPPIPLLDSASASSLFSSTTSSPSTSALVAETLPDFDTSSSNLEFQYSPLSSAFLQADSYIKFPSDHYLLAASPKSSVYQVLQRPSN